MLGDVAVFLFIIIYHLKEENKFCSRNKPLFETRAYRTLGLARSIKDHGKFDVDKNVYLAQYMSHLLRRWNSQLWSRVVCSIGKGLVLILVGFGGSSRVG